MLLNIQTHFQHLYHHMIFVNQYKRILSFFHHLSIFKEFFFLSRWLFVSSIFRSVTLYPHEIHVHSFSNGRDVFLKESIQCLPDFPKFWSMVNSNEYFIFHWVEECEHALFDIFLNQFFFRSVAFSSKNIVVFLYKFSLYLWGKDLIRFDRFLSCVNSLILYLS